MRIAIGSDHAGYELKNTIVKYLLKKKIEVHDMGTFSIDSVDYPDFAVQVCKSIKRDANDLGILICYTGIGMSMAANKHNGIRAALVTTVENAILTREHNNANVLCMGAKDVSEEVAKEIVDAFISSKFTEGRHLRRVEKLTNIEKYENR